MDAFEYIKRDFDGNQETHRLFLPMTLQENRSDYDAETKEIILTK